jgi:hypothetical protein
LNFIFDPRGPLDGTDGDSAIAVWMSIRVERIVPSEMRRMDACRDSKVSAGCKRVHDIS